MTSKLYIASKPATLDSWDPQHLYLVYDPDGVINSGDERIIRGGPPSGTTGVSGFINIEVGVRITESEDGAKTIQTLPSAESRNFTLLEEGNAATALWEAMISFAVSLSNDDNAAPGAAYLTGFTYAPTNSNSNSTVASVMASAGLNVQSYLPVLGGDLDGDGIRDGSSPPETSRVTFADVPGAHAFLSGGQGNTFVGGNGTNVFYDTANADGDSGYDVFNGGNGKDYYYYIQSGPSQSLTWSAIRDGNGNIIGDKIQTPDGKYDNLYSVEVFSKKTYDNTHKFMYQFNAGLNFNDVTETELASLNSNLDSGYEDIITALEIDFGSGHVRQFANFGSFVGTDYADKFSLNLLIGRTFDGGDGQDTVDYGDIEGVLTINMRPDQRIAFLASTPGVTDSLSNIETVLGAEEYSNTFQGALGPLAETDPTYTFGYYQYYNWDYSNLLTFGGGLQSDTYEFDFEDDAGVVYITDFGTDDTDRVVIANVSDDVSESVHGGINLMLWEHEGDRYVNFNVSHVVAGLGLQLRVSDAIEEIDINGITISMASLLMYAHYDSHFSVWVYSAASLRDAVYKGGPVSNGENYDENVTPTLDGTGNVAGMTVSSAVGGQWTPTNIATESHHGWVVTGLTSDSGYTSLTATTALKDISFAEGIAAADVRLTATSSPTGNANLVLRIDSLNYSLTVTGFEAGRTINGIGLYDTALHGHIADASAVAVESTAAGQYTVQYNAETSYTPGSVSALYFLETLNFADNTVIDLLNDQLTFTGTSANESLYGLNTRDDIIVGLGGNDTMYGYGGADVFHGGDGVDTIYGGDGNDVLNGDAGNDNLYGDAGNDTLHGGAGNDALRGGAGDDTYVFDRNFSGTTAGDIIYENASDGFDTIRFTDSIEAEEVFSWTDSSGYLWMQVGSTAATNTLKAQGSYSSTTGVTTRIEQVVFDDATVWDLTQGLHLRNTDTARTFYGSAYGDILEGGSAAETIYGYGGNDTLVGNGGNDTLRGGDGNDSYLFGYGFSLNATGDRIIETATGGTDTIRFTDSIAPTEVYSWTDTSGFLWFQLGTNPASNTLKADGAYSASTGITAYVEQVAFDDTTIWDLTQGLHLRNNDTGRQMYGSALGDWIEGGAGADTLRGFGGDDVLIGRSGNDGLYGGAGEDTFVFLASDVGNGIDTLYDFSVTDDVIDLRDVLDSGYDPIADVLSDFVRFTNSGSNSKLEVDMDGAGTTYGWTQIATVNGHINLDAVTLETNGHLLAA